MISGQTWQQPPYHHRLKVASRDDGSLEVVREVVERLDVSRSTLVVPFQVGLKARPADDPDARSILNGRTVIQGNKGSFRFEIEHEPDRRSRNPGGSGSSGLETTSRHGA